MLSADSTLAADVRTMKYVCIHCGISVRATKDVNILCGDCMDTMAKVD